MNEELLVHRPDFYMIECTNCGGLFTVSSETLYKLQGLLKPEQIKLPQCIFCECSKTKVREKKYASSP